MDTDYRNLCIKLFGTDDVEKLKQIAKTVQEKNARNAGRKKKFTTDDVLKMRAMLDEGNTINEVANYFETSRQMISKYIHAAQKPADSVSLRISYIYRNQPCTIIDVDFLNRKIMIQNKTEDLLHRAFGVVKEPTWEDFEDFLKDRCFPESRGDVKELLHNLNLTDYDPLQIVEKTQGRTVDDDMWMKFTYYPGKE